MADLAFLNNQEPAPEAPLFDFEDQQESMFANLDPMAGYEFGPPEEPNPITEAVGAMALTETNVASRPEALTALEQARNYMRTALEEGKEDMVRSQVALDRVTRKRTELDLAVPQFTETPLYKSGGAYGEQVAETNLNNNLKSAMEKEAIERVQDLAAAGDYTQARIILNRLRPENTDLVGAWHDNMSKSLMLSQLAQKFKAEDDQEGYFAMAYTGLISMLQPSSFSMLGNVDDGINGYVERSALARFFSPGTELQNQASAIWSMNAEELANYLPTLESNIRSNSSYLGVINPDKLVELGSYFEKPLGDIAATGSNIMANIETGLTYAPGVGIVPYNLGAKALSLPFTMVRAGARKEAAGAVAQAYREIATEGVAARGLDEALVIDNMMPSAINPEKGTVDLNISLSGETNEFIRQAEELAEAWAPRSTERFASEEERLAAIQAKVDEVADRYGAPALDVKVRRQQLSDGTHTNVVEVTLGDPRTKGLFATEQEAQSWRVSHGFDEGVVHVDTPAPRTVTPRELGYNDIVYHGTRTEVKGGLRPSTGGAFGRGIYTSTDPEYAGSYAGRKAVGAPQMHPLLVNGEKVFGYKQLTRQWTAGEIRAAYKQLGVKPTKFMAMTLKGMKADEFVALENTQVMDHFAEAVNKNALGPNDVFRTDYSVLADRLESKGFHGHAVAPRTGDKLDTEVIIYAEENAKPLFERKIVQDPSGGFANKIELDIPETGFYTELNTPRQGAGARFLKNISQTSDENLYGKGLVADQKANRLYDQIGREMRAAYNPLTKQEKTWFEQVAALQQNEGRWFTREENANAYERATGKPPRQEVLDALDRYHVLNDLDFLLRRDGVYRGKVIRGYESLKFQAFDDVIDIDGIVNYSPSKAPPARAYDISNDIHYVGDRALTDAQVQNLRDRGYVMFRTEKDITLKDGTTINHFIAKKSDVAVRRLRREQLGYTPGGHRIYQSRYQVKQAKFISQPDTGTKSLTSPSTFVMANNIRDARVWAAVMNEARIAAKNGLSAEHLDQHIFKGEKGYPKGEEFLDLVAKGHIDKDAPFEALYDRELPSEYKGAPDLEAILGEDALNGTNNFYRSTGRMYYSSRGDHMKDTYGELAPTIDPFKAQAQGLFNVARLSASFGDFKESAIQRWVNKYKDYLETRNLDINDARSTYTVFNKAEVRDGIDFELKQQILGQRESIRRILGFETEMDRNYRHWLRSTSEWIIGDSDNALRKKASEGVFWLYENNPVSFLRGWAFDLKLGLFNVGQVFIQGSTMASAIALNPRHGKFGLQSAMSTFGYFMSKGNENVLEQLVKNGMPKLAGFTSAEEYKAYVRNAMKSGFFDLGSSHVMVNDLGAERFASSLTSGTQHVREMGRWFFYNVEVMNRLVAHRIAYGEALEKFGEAAWSNFKFQEFIARRAENYSFNMSNASKSWWQTGLMSIPTQFWAYNVRMIEALTGSNFTGAQRLRLLGVQMAMAGTAGVPVVAGIVDMIKTKYGVEPDIDSMAGVLHRGLADYMVYEMFGADVNIGERWGTGSWSSDLLRDIFGYSEFNNKTFADIAFGATYSITKGVLEPLFGDALPVALRWMTHESGSEEIDMTGEELLTMFRQISTANHALQAWEVYNYGIFKSSKGKVLADNLPSEDAVFVSLGFAPNQMNEMTVMTGYMKQRQEMIKDAASQIVAWKQEALNRPDMFETNAKKTNAFVKFLPADIKKDVLKQVRRQTDPSIYSGIKDRFEQTRQTERIMENVQSGQSN